jgi:hypothetical protein
MSRPYRKISGVKISNNHGKNWRTAAICDQCEKSLEPPTMAKNEGLAGVRSCD